MITLCIRYTLDPTKLAQFESYARSVPGHARRCGAEAAVYYLPTKFPGPTNAALARIDFPSLAACEQYRERLANDPEAADVPRRAETSGCVLIEDPSIVRRAG